MKNPLSPRPSNTHKGDFGHVLVIGGDYGMAGAVRMAGEAAARVGAGLVTVATRPEHIAVVSSVRPELLCYGIKKISDLKKLLPRATVIIVGPGLGQSTWSQQLFKQALTAKQPKVIDADALNLLAKQPRKNKNWILTPHPGEAARLLRCDAATIQEDRFASIKRLYDKFGGTIILKGAATITLSSDLIPHVCPRGNPGMASGGMGDVLSGVLGGLLAQGLSLSEAGEFGVWLHAQAGDLAAKKDERGLLALDLMPFLRELVNDEAI